MDVYFNLELHARPTCLFIFNAAQGSLTGGLSGQDMKLTIHLHLLLRSRKRASILSLRRMSSWRSAQLVRQRDNFICSYFILEKTNIYSRLLCATQNTNLHLHAIISEAPK
jgi:hypothetical protein